MKSKTVDLKSVGTVLIERSRRAKRISVSIRPFKGVRVAVPYGVSFETAQTFAQSKTGWIKKHLGKMERLEQRANTLANPGSVALRPEDQTQCLSVAHSWQRELQFP